LIIFLTNGRIELKKIPDVMAMSGAAKLGVSIAVFSLLWTDPPGSLCRRPQLPSIYKPFGSRPCRI